MTLLNDDRLNRDQIAFLERHRDADMLITDNRLGGHASEAIYYSPMRKAHDTMQANAAEFFRQIRELDEGDLP